MNVVIKCTYEDEKFYNQLIDLVEHYSFITRVEGYDMTYSDTKVKGWGKCKSTFASKKDPFVGIWVDDIPNKGFYSEDNTCNINTIEKYLNKLDNENSERNNTNDRFEN